MSRNGTIQHDARTVGFAEFGDTRGPAILWSHGGPGNRLFPTTVPGAELLPARSIGIDRPGYGLSTPKQGRSIGDWVGDALAVADHLGIDRFTAVGGSTGGAYALALAALAPQRVEQVLVFCGVGDLRDPELRASIAANRVQEIWDAPSREGALVVAREVLGDDGSGMGAALDGATPPIADLELMQRPDFMQAFMGTMAQCFTFGVEGFVDDRLADGPGWVSFDVSLVRCPVSILHGAQDTAVPVAHALSVARLVPDARVTTFEHHGHLSICLEVAPALTEMLGMR